MRPIRNTNPIETRQDAWIQYANNQGGEKSKYKLHVALPPSHFHQYHEAIDFLLKEAVQTGIISGFKKNAAVTPDSKNERLISNPFTIYLFADTNFPRLAQLCRRIDALIVSTPAADRRSLSVADLDLTTHITFRQESLADKYITIATANESELAQLVREASESSEYTTLRSYCAADEESISAEMKEYELVDFYNIAYNRIEKELDCTKLTIQFKAACELLGIDKNEFQEKRKKDPESAKEWLNKAIKTYRFKTHSDKNKKCIVVAEKLFTMGTKAGALLQILIENSSIDISDAELKQDAKNQSHQYELAEGFKEDPYYYVSTLAAHNEPVRLNQFWEKKEDQKLQITYQIAPEEKSKLLTISAPGEQKIFKTPLVVTHSGRDAFYHLFMSDALALQFDRTHLSMCLVDTSGTIRDRNLLHLALTTPKFINFMHAYDRIRFAKKATAEKIIAIGERVDQIFLYYYNNFPETLWWAKEALSEEYSGEFDAKFIEDKILENPQSLYLLPKFYAMKDMLRLGSRLCQFILNDKVLFEKIDNSDWQYVIVKSFIEERCTGLSRFKQISIENLLVARPPCAYLSSVCLNELLAFLQQTKMSAGGFEINVPQWALALLRTELMAREQAQSCILGPEKAEVPSSYSTEIKINYAYIKKQLFSDNPITPIDCTLLSETILLALSEDPDTHISFHYEIGMALQLTNNKAAEKILSTFKQKYPHIQITSEAVSSESKTSLELMSLRQAWKRQTQEELQNEWLSIIVVPPVNVQKISEIRIKLAGIADQKQQAIICRAVEEKLHERYNNAYERFCKYDIPEDEKERNALRQDVLAYNTAYENLPHAQKTPDFHKFEHNLGNDGFNTFQCILDSTKPLPKNTYGIRVRELPIMVALEKLFFFYDCLLVANRFYQILPRIPGRSLPPELEKATTFNKDAIKEYLISYLDHELSVYFDNKRENVSYRTHRIMGFTFDQQNIQNFGMLRSLYIGIGEENHYLSLLRQGWEKISDSNFGNIKGEDILKHEPRFTQLRLSWFAQRNFPSLFSSSQSSTQQLAITEKSLGSDKEKKSNSHNITTVISDQKTLDANQENLFGKKPQDIVNIIKTILMTRKFIVSFSQGHEITDDKGNTNSVSRGAYNVYQLIQSFEKNNEKNYDYLFTQINNELRTKTTTTTDSDGFSLWKRSEETTKNYRAIIDILDKYKKQSSKPLHLHPEGANN